MNKILTTEARLSSSLLYPLKIQDVPVTMPRIALLLQSQIQLCPLC